MRQQPSHQRMSDVIGLIYDSAVDPKQWPRALEHMCGLIDSGFGSITIADPGLPNFRFVSRWGGDPYWVDLLDHKYANMMPFASVLDRFDIGLPFNLAMAAEMLGDADVWNGPFNTEWAVPAGVRDAASAVVLRSARRLASVSLATGVDREPVTPAELEIVGLLAPHVRRALTISDLIDMKSLAVDTFERMLDAIQFGVLVVDGRCRVRHANQAASAMLSAGSPLATRGGKVMVPGSVGATTVLHEAISRVASDEASLAGTGAGLPLRFGDGRPAIGHVLPLRKRAIRHGLGTASIAAIFIATPTDGQQAPIEALAGLYGLTEAESRVLKQFAAGKNRGEVAASLAVADSTVKTHLERIFSKTGTSTQSELARLLTSLSAPVTPA